MSNTDTDWERRVLASIVDSILAHPDAETQLVETLQWRGFLAIRNSDGVFLQTGNADADKKDISLLTGHTQADQDDLKSLSEILTIERLSDQDIAAHVSWSDSEGDNRQDEVRRILEIPSPTGMTPAGYDFKYWEQFRECQYPYGLATEELDLGVSLLVRALPLICVPTRVSGHGITDRRRLYVEFDGPYAGAWFKAIFETRLANRLSQAELFQIRFDNNRCSLEIGQQADAFTAFRASQDLARLLIQPDVFKPIQKLKNQACLDWSRRFSPTEFYKHCIECD